MKKAACLFFIAFIVLPVYLLAQSYTASIVGVVTDPSQAGIPGAKLVATDVNRNQQYTATTDTAGRYVLTALRPGSYTLTVEAAGFKKYARSAFDLQVDQQARIDVALELGAMTESITVPAEAPLLEASNSSIGKVVTNKDIINLPLNTRNSYALVFLTPGVSGTVGINYDDMRYSVNGARVRMLDTLVDGVAASHPTVNGAGGVSVFPSVDAIQEFKVMGANPPAEIGRSQGSVLNVVFKSGGNKLHGSGYEFLRNSVLDANNFFDNRRGTELASFKRSQFGGMLSGPIRKEKTFFMGSYEGLRELSFASSTFTVPTPRERQGDFSQTFAANGQTIKIFNPFSTRPNPSGSGFIRDPFTDNVVPPALFDPVALNVVKYYPLPNTAGAAVTNQNNYAKSGSRQLFMDQYDIRVDHNLSDTQRFFARYSYRDISDAPPVYFPKELAIAEGRVINTNKPINVVADYTHNLSPSTILTTRLGFARTLFIYANQGLGFVPSSLGLPKSIDLAVDRQMFPAISASGYKGLGGNDHRRSGFNSFNLVANLTKVKGGHTLKTGFDGRLIRTNIWEARDAGSFSFGAGMTQGPDPTRASSTAGNGMASLLLGTGSGGNLYQAWKNVAAQSFYYAFYFQDDWRLNRKLTLNLGVRYDLDTPRTERFNRINYFDPLVRSPLAAKVAGFSDLRGGLVFVGVDGNSRWQYQMDKNNLAPRLGLAYQATRHTVIRAAYGHLFGLSPQEAMGTVGPYGFRTENTWVTSLDGITPFNLLRNPYPQGFQPPPGATQGLLTGAGGTLQAPLHDTATPWSMQWNFTIQHELPAQVMIETAYVGTRGLQLSRGGEGGFTLNQLTPDKMALGSKLNEQVDNPFYGIVNSGLLVSPKISRRQLLRPYPQFGDVIPLFSSGASSTYHSLQVSAIKRLSRGVQFAGSYTWAKSLDNGESYQNSYNVKGARALTSLDVAHRFVMSYIYMLPFGRGKRFGGAAPPVVNALLGGWQVNGITTFQTGTPVGIGASNTANIFGQTMWANNNGKSGKLSGAVDQRLNAYFDKSVFSQPDPYTFGNLGPTLPDIRNDGIRNFDLSLFKEFAPVERMRVQFRAEMLNSFNTPRFSGPNTSVTSSSFGTITSQANAPRQVQFGLKLLW